jgi:hypothetical protein
MFGMLDYRAHKLFRVLVKPAVFLLSILNILCLPFIAYLIAIKIASVPGTQFLLALAVLFLLTIPWSFVVKMILAVPVGIFNFLIDPEPAGGRSKEEAKVVVASGDKGIFLLEFGKKPVSAWTDEDIDRIAKINSRFFQRTVRQRLHAMRKYYNDNPAVVPNGKTNKKFLTEKGLSVGWLETIVTNPNWTGPILQLAALLVIFIGLSA